MAFPTVQELFDLHGRVAIVTGEARNLGLQMTEAGANIIITSRRREIAYMESLSTLHSKVLAGSSN